MIKLSVFIFCTTTAFHISAQDLQRFQDEKNNKYGFKDAGGKVIVKAAYDIAYEFQNGEKYTVVNMGANYANNKGGKWGAIDNKGKLVIPVKYDRVTYIGYNLFAVNVGDVFSDMDESIEGKFALFNSTGKALTPFLYSQISEFNEGMAGVETFDAKTETQKAGYFDSTGKLVVPLKYDGVAYGFMNGYAVVVTKNKNGMIDKKGKVVIPVEYEHLSNLWDEGIIQAEKNGKVGFINIKNEVSIPFLYDGSKCSSDGLIAVNIGGTKSPSDVYSKGGKWGFIDYTGKEIIPIQYDNVYCFSKGKAEVMKDGKKLIIDKTGKEIK